jgi:hypothetical protein
MKEAEKNNSSRTYFSADFPAYRERRTPRKSLMTEKGIIRSTSVAILELGNKFIVTNKKCTVKYHNNIYSILVSFKFCYSLLILLILLVLFFVFLFFFSYILICLLYYRHVY